MSPYYVDHGRCRILVFPRTWIGTILPVGSFSTKQGESKYLFEVTLLDTRDGKEYLSREYACYEDPAVFDNSLAAVQEYMYADHFCACHRKIAAANAGADTDEECEGERFLVKSIRGLNTPNLVLYSETMSLDELAATLQ